jgi:hypothetical protein
MYRRLINALLRVQSSAEGQLPPGAGMLLDMSLGSASWTPAVADLGRIGLAIVISLRRCPIDCGEQAKQHMYIQAADVKWGGGQG